MKTALVFGSTGLIGKHLLNILIDNNNYSKVKIFVRSHIEINNKKVEIVKIDFNKLENHKEEISGEHCFFCIGTTKQDLPDKNLYKKVELDIPKEIAKIAKSNLVKSFIFISSIYANSKSSSDYVKFKGLVEEELIRLNFFNLAILRPSFLMGNRKKKRIGEMIGILIFRFFSPLLLGPLKKMKPIESEKVAKAMVKLANLNQKKTTFESDEIDNLNLN